MDLFLIRFCSCHSFLLFCFGISALGLFCIGSLFVVVCQWLQGMRIVEFVTAFPSYLFLKIQKYFSFASLCILAFLHSHGTCIRFLLLNYIQVSI